jgi:hypothetical protein
VPPPTGCPMRGPSSPEVTRAICRVPSTPFSQAPWYALPAHLCRFRVRSKSWGYFLEVLGCIPNPLREYNVQPSSTPSRPGNINPVPIDYGSRPRLRGRLTLRGLTLRRNPWAFGDRVSHPVCRYSCQHSHFRYLQHPSRDAFTGLRNAPLPRDPKITSAASVCGLSPDTFSAQDGLSRPVSCYAFFKGWLLLSQPPGCLGLPTSFPT